MNSDHVIIDYKVIVRQMNTDFFGNTESEQPHFESAAKDLLNKGYIPHDEFKTTSGSAGGFFSSSQYPTMTQAFVLYGTMEEKAEWDRKELEKKQAALEARREALKRDKPFAIVYVAMGLLFWVWLIYEFAY